MLLPEDIFITKNGHVSSANLAGKYKKNWIENSLQNDSGYNSNANKVQSYLGISIGKKRLMLFIVFCVFLFALVLGKVFFLQIFKGSSYLALAEGNRIRVRPIISERGILLDRFGTELVQNVPSFTLTIVPQDLPTNIKERQRIINELSKLSAVPEQDILAILRRFSGYSYESLVVKENLDYQTAINLYIENAHLPGVRIESTTRRHYLHSAPDKGGESLSHVLGYLGKLSEDDLHRLKEKGYLISDLVGKSGIEMYYETILRGTYGRERVEVNALGKEQTILAVEPPIPGSNITLTIDLEAQTKIEELIKEQSTKINTRKFAVIVLNPNNGEILALVSWPSFNNSLFSGGISNENYKQYQNDKDAPLFNRAIAGTYPPGSTIKPLIAAAALEEGLVTSDKTFISNGGIQVGRWYFRDWRAGGHGVTNITKAIAWSVNTYFYYIGGGFQNFEGLGLEKISTYLRSFGVAALTGIDLPGEKFGFMPTRQWKIRVKNEAWFVGDTYNLAIGQGDLLVTPLQVSLWTAAVANGGKIITPHLAKEITNSAENESKKISPDLKNNPFVSANTMNIVAQGMKDCVSYGSCSLLQTLPFSSAGKTGTAQWSNVKETHAWFTAYAPAANPKVVVTVLAEEGGEGAAAAMPIARDFLRWWGNKYLTS